jgi:protein-tyrosine-phosphatase
MAEGLLRKMAADHQWDLQVQSAGMAAFAGVPATPEAVEAAGEWGVDLSAHQSRPLGKDQVMDCDLILTMAAMHKNSILKKLPHLEGKVFTLAEFAGVPDEEVEDPVGQSLEVYRKVLKQIEGYLQKASDKFKG